MAAWKFLAPILACLYPLPVPVTLRPFIARVHAQEHRQYVRARVVRMMCVCALVCVCHLNACVCVCVFTYTWSVSSPPLKGVKSTRRRWCGFGWRWRKNWEQPPRLHRVEHNACVTSNWIQHTMYTHARTHGVFIIPYSRSIRPSTGFCRLTFYH
jgi:hypothetical protein